MCKIVGIGSIKIRMIDGIRRTLYNVRHAPRLKRNLCSLGMLDCPGYFFMSKNDSLRIIKGTEMVMKGVKTICLYVLEGSPVPMLATIPDVLK